MLVVELAGGAPATNAATLSERFAFARFDAVKVVPALTLDRPSQREDRLPALHRLLDRL